MDEIFQQPMDRFLTNIHMDSYLTQFELSGLFVVLALTEIVLIQCNNESLQQELALFLLNESLESSA